MHAYMNKLYALKVAKRMNKLAFIQLTLESKCRKKYFLLIAEHLRS